YCPSVELLETRDTPTNLSVTFTPLTHTLAIVGNSAANQLTIAAVSGGTSFRLTSLTDSINGVNAPLTTASRVWNISVQWLDGNDSVTLDNSVHIDLVNLSINGGNGHNTVTATDLTAEGNIRITNGTNSGGTSDSTRLVNLTVGGSLIIHNGDGDTDTR